MAKKESKKRQQAALQFALVLAALILVNVLANSRLGGRSMYAAWDLTEDQRFSLTDNTKEQLDSLDEVVYIQVLMEGEFPATYERLKQAVRAMLEDFRSRSSYIEYEFINPTAGPVEVVRERQQQLARDGIVPVTLVQQTANERETKAIYPYLIFNYANRTETVNLLQSNAPGKPADLIVNESISRLEYYYSSTLERLLDANRPLIAFSEGQGELSQLKTADLEARLRLQYDVGRLSLDSVVAIPQDIKLLIVAKPTQAYDQRDLFKLDQYIMNGGKVLWALDGVAMDLDSLQNRNEYYPNPYELGLDELFFRYGFRINNDLVLDMNNTQIPIAVSRTASGPQIEKFDFPYHVVAVPDPNSDHPVIKNVDPIDLRFPSSIDIEIETPDPIEKTLILQSSSRARYQRLPAAIDLDVQKYSLDIERFNRDSLLMGVLLEGVFHSPYANRLSSSFEQTLQNIGQEFQAQSPPNRMIVVSDGDLLANTLDREGRPRPLGFNRYQGYQFANKDLALNMIEYLLDPEGVVGARGKEVKLRLLDRVGAQTSAAAWRLLNIGLPLVFLLLFGLAYNFIRRRRFTH